MRVWNTAPRTGSIIDRPTAADQHQGTPPQPLEPGQRHHRDEVADVEGVRRGIEADGHEDRPDVLPFRQDGLLDRGEGVQIVGYEEFGNTHGADEKQRIAALPEFLRDRRIDAVISGMGC